MLLSRIVHFLSQASTLRRCPQPQPCEGLTLKVGSSIPDIQILSLTSHEVHNYQSPYTQGKKLDFCDVTVTLTHANESDLVQLSVWLPFPSAWNGRFLATGGGGLATGYIGYAQPAAVIQGYAAAATEGGLTLNGTIDPQTGQWGLRTDGTLNTALLTNYAHRSVHDLAVLGKALTTAFYGTAPRFSYWHGCSTGGRQGFVAAALYPADYDGILAASPGIHLPELFAWLFWPPALMLNASSASSPPPPPPPPPQCVFSAFQRSIIEACDALDGAADGLISGSGDCPFDASGLVNTTIPCAETNTSVTITEQHATLVQAILDGPVDPATGDTLWYGLPPGASFRGTADTITTTTTNETHPTTATTTTTTTRINPFLPAVSWLRNFLLKSPTYNISTLTIPQFVDAVHASREQFGDLLSKEQLGLEGFQQAGGKLLAWHGLADEIVPPAGTVKYREMVGEAFSEQNVEVEDFFRLFLAPGAGHCGGNLGVGYGPVPVDALGALVRWVEDAVEPETLFAEVTGGGRRVTRELCLWPGVLRWDGEGGLDLAGSFGCEE
ncbi:feruloyl esterase [Aspergillus aculeatinus CBS 121060]|uniref:Feruloyl esterase n=1 Tax=Aspergillus aculeatinus CBS 121060 TaxID=1448322 RepID=A0ACD1H911_9EURO|nr:feruloyl esterase [Aspergillus aculeatinus CBS 121060]RAH70006.1 feruloyl esterase [Aspergillus aculeatinus CBS 121060]